MQESIQLNKITVDILLNLYGEVQALRNMVVAHISDTEETEKEYKRIYNEDFNETKKTILAQIKAHYYSDESPDEILQSAFPKD